MADSVGLNEVGIDSKRPNPGVSTKVNLNGVAAKRAATTGNFQRLQSGAVEGPWEVLGSGLAGSRKNSVVVLKVVISPTLDKVLSVSHQRLLAL